MGAGRTATVFWVLCNCCLIRFSILLILFVMSVCKKRKIMNKQHCHSNESLPLRGGAH